MPEECPQEIADLIQQCKLVEPKQRPSAKEVFEILRKNCMAKRYNGSITWSCCHEQFAVHACNLQVQGLECINVAYLPCFITHLSLLRAALHGAPVYFGEVSANFV